MFIHNYDQDFINSLQEPDYDENDEQEYYDYLESRVMHILVTLQLDKKSIVEDNVNNKYKYIHIENIVLEELESLDNFLNIIKYLENKYDPLVENIDDYEFVRYHIKCDTNECLKNVTEYYNMCKNNYKHIVILLE